VGLWLRHPHAAGYAGLSAGRVVFPRGNTVAGSVSRLFLRCRGKKQAV